MSIASNISRTPVIHSAAYFGGIDSLIRHERCSNGEDLDEEDLSFLSSLSLLDLCLLCDECLCLDDSFSFELVCFFFELFEWCFDDEACAFGSDMMVRARLRKVESDNFKARASTSPLAGKMTFNRCQRLSLMHGAQRLTTIGIR